MLDNIDVEPSPRNLETLDRKFGQIRFEKTSVQVGHRGKSIE